MKNFIRIILIISLLNICLFVNLYDYENKHIWNLIYYSQFYLIIFAFSLLGWKLFNDILIRSLLIPLCLYYLFHFVVNLIEIFDSELKEKIFSTLTVNYLLSASCGGSLLILYLIKIIKKNQL